MLASRSFWRRIFSGGYFRRIISSGCTVNRFRNFGELIAGLTETLHPETFIGLLSASLLILLTNCCLFFSTERQVERLRPARIKDRGWASTYVFL